MSCAVNLLPESCHDARRRAVRRYAWTVAVLLAVLPLVAAGIALHMTERAIRRLEVEFSYTQMRQSELDRRLMLGLKQRNELADRARTLCGLRQEHPLPRQLLALTRAAPDGVAFTEIQAQPDRGASPPPRPATRRPRAASAGQPVTPAPRPPPSVAVQMSGFAVDHYELTRLIDALRQVPRWEQVELLRATRDPSRSGEALAFRLACRPATSAPRGGRDEASGARAGRAEVFP